MIPRSMRAVEANLHCPPLETFTSASNMKRSKFTFWHGLVILLGIVLVSMVFLWVMLSGVHLSD